MRPKRLIAGLLLAVAVAPGTWLRSEPRPPKLGVVTAGGAA